MMMMMMMMVMMMVTVMMIGLHYEEEEAAEEAAAAEEGWSTTSRRRDLISEREVAYAACSNLRTEGETSAEKSEDHSTRVVLSSVMGRHLILERTDIVSVGWLAPTRFHEMVQNSSERPRRRCVRSSPVFHRIFRSAPTLVAHSPSTSSHVSTVEMSRPGNRKSRNTAHTSSSGSGNTADADA